MLPSVATRARRFARAARSQEPETPAEAALERAWLRLERFVAERLRRTTTLREFDDRSDRILDAKEFHRYWREATALVPNEFVLRVLSGQDVASALSAGLPEGLRAGIREVAQLTAVAAKASFQFRFAILLGRASLPPLFASLGERGKPLAPKALVADPRLPAAVKRAAMGGWRAEVCTVAVLTARQWGASEELLAGVVGRWASSLRRQLGLLAALPGVDLPADDLVGVEVLDLDRLATQHAESESGFKRRLREAAASGLDVYPPFEAGDE
jgi:hypothetical protein